MKKILILIFSLTILFVFSMNTRGMKMNPQELEELARVAAHEIPVAQRGGSPHPHAYGYEPKGYPDSINNITVKYTNAIHGMKVEAKWEPIGSYGRSHMGEAIIKFTNIESGKSFSIYNSSFGINTDKVKDLNIFWPEMEDNGGVYADKLKFDRGTIHLEYEEPELKYNSDVLKRFYDFDVPFFFHDIDFDGNEELIVVLRSAGQRHSDIFKVYALKDGSLVDEREQMTDIAPYIEIDGLSTIDIKNKTINIHSSSGACDNSCKLYKFYAPKNATEKGKYILEEYSLRETVRDEKFENCNSYVYRVDGNKKLTLISMEILSSTSNSTTSKELFSPIIKAQPEWVQTFKGKQILSRVIPTKKGDYKVSLGIFDAKPLAEKYKTELANKKNLLATIEEKDKEWEVFIGPYPSEEEALQQKKFIN
jgi:hypothetical protein